MLMLAKTLEMKDTWEGDNDDGIRLDIIKKNTAVFPIGTLIGNLTLTPKDPTKLPILLCAVYHRYFT